MEYKLYYITHENCGLTVVGYTDCGLYSLWVMGCQCGLYGLWVVFPVGCIPVRQECDYSGVTNWRLYSIQITQSNFCNSIEIHQSKRWQNWLKNALSDRCLVKSVP